MTVEDIKQETNKNPSDELIEMIDSLVMTYKVTTEERDKQVKAIIEKGRAEELSDKQIRGLIETSLHKHGLSDRTIYRALPDELKDKTKQQANLMRKTIGNKKVETETIDIPVPEPVIERKPLEHKTRVEQIQTPEEYAYGHEDTAMINKDTDTQQDTPVYREPDRIEPKPEWIPTTKPELEQSYHTMNVPDKSQIPSSEWMVHNQPQDYTVTTQLQIYNGTGNNIGQFTVDVVAKCYPSKKTVVLEPIDKATIKKVVA